MRTDTELLMLAKSVLEIDFPTTEEIFNIAYIQRKRELTGDELELLETVWKEVFERKENKKFFDESVVQQKTEERPEMLNCWNCMGKGKEIESFPDHINGGRRTVERTCEVCHGRGTMYQQNFKNSMSKFSKISDMKPTKGPTNFEE